jgi:[protein-PII] uridylyltransferase
MTRLIRNQSLLADAATRRDLDDPATAGWVAQRVGSVEELELLAAFTKADGLATGPGAWTPWKAALVDALVDQVRAYLAGERRESVAFTPTAAQRVLIESREVHVVADGSRVEVVAPDSPGLLALLAGVLALHRLPVRSATAATIDGMVVDSFDVDLTDRDAPDVRALQSDIVKFLVDPDALRRRLAQRAKSSRLPRRRAPEPAPPFVLVVNDATPKATILEVRSPDGFAVLSRIGAAITACGCDIEFARVLTLGHEVVDTFYVVDVATRGRIFDPKRTDALAVAIVASLEPEV